MRRKGLRPWTKGLLGAVLAIGVLSSAALVSGYNPFQEKNVATGGPVPSRWQNLPIDWFLNPATPKNNVSTTGCSGTAASCIQTALVNAFTTWTSTPLQGQMLTNLSVNPPGTSTATAPDAKDCLNTVRFSDTDTSDFSTGTIAFTEVATVTGPSPSFTYSCTTGSGTRTCNLPSCIADADIEFNPSEKFTTSTSPPSDTFSIQSVAAHEEGHLLGLDHSGIGHTVMFPFGDTTAAGQQLNLSTDDTIGIGFLYPSQNFSTATGQISGKVTLNGSGAFAARVTAIDVNTGNVVIDGLTNPDGTYTLVGVPPGIYNVLVLPLATADSSGIVSLDNFSAWACGYGQNSPPCCDPATDSSCTGTLNNPTNYTGRFY